MTQAGEIERALDDWMAAADMSGCAALGHLAPGISEADLRAKFASVGVEPTASLLAIYGRHSGYTGKILRTLASLAPGIEWLDVDEAINGYQEFVAVPLIPDGPSWPGWFPAFYSPNGYILTNTVESEEHPVDAVRIYGSGQFGEVCGSLIEVIGWITGFIQSGRWYWVSEAAAWDSTLTYAELTPKQRLCPIF